MHRYQPPNNGSRRAFKASSSEPPSNQGPAASGRSQTSYEGTTANSSERPLENSSVSSPIGSRTSSNAMPTSSRRHSAFNQTSFGNNSSLQGLRRGSVASPRPSTNATDLIINIREERERPDSNPRAPAFISNIMGIATYNEATWSNIIIPQISEAVFVMESTQDVEWIKKFLTAENHPRGAYLAITKVRFPNFHWFSGISHNRTHNPYIVAAAALTNLRELTLGLHTASLTASVFGEKERMQLEKEDFRKSKELKALPARSIVVKYGLDGLFHCKALHTLKLTCIDSDIVAYYCKTSNPVSVAYDIKAYLQDGFRWHGRAVTVTVDVEGANAGQ